MTVENESAKNSWDLDADLWSFSAHTIHPKIDVHQILMNRDLNHCTNDERGDKENMDAHGRPF